MKEKFLKVTAMWQVIVMILSIVISLFTIVQTTSIAQVDYNVLDRIVMDCTQVNTKKHKYSDAFGNHTEEAKYGIYIRKTQYNDKVGEMNNIESESSKDWNSIYLDSGVQFYIIPVEWYNKRKKRSNSKVSDFNYTWNIIFNNEIIKYGTGMEPYTFNYSDIQSRIVEGHDYANCRVEVYKNKKIEYGQNIHIAVRKPQITSTSTNAYFEPQKYMDTLYVKPGSKIQLTNTFNNNTNRGKGTYTIEDSNKNGFSLSGNTLTTPSLLGLKVTIKYRNTYGSTSYADAIVSNYVSGCSRYTAGNSKTKIEAINQIYKKGDVTSNITKKATVNFGETGIIKIKVDSFFNNRVPTITGFWASAYDGYVSNVKGEAKFNQNYEQLYEISFNTTSGGIIKFSYKDYKNVNHDEYIKVEGVNKDVVIIDDPKNEEVVIIEEPVNKKTPEKQNDNQQGSQQGSQQGNQPKQEIIINPTIKITETQKSSSTVEFNVSVTDNTYAKYYFERRDSNGVIQNATPLNYKSYNANKGDGANDVHNFKATLTTIGTNKVEPGAYNLVVIAANQYDDHCSCSRSANIYWVNAEPIPIIQTISNPTDSKNRIKNYNISGTDPDGNSEDISIWYYVVKKNAPSKPATLTKETIKSKGTKIADANKTLKFGVNSNEYKEAGSYDIHVCVEDKMGAYKISSVANILVNNSPNISYEILGEKGTSEEGYTYSDTEDNKKTVRINVTDPEGNAVHGWYIASSVDVTKGGTATPEQQKNAISTEIHGPGKKATYFNVKESSTTFDVELDASNGSDIQYIYVIAGDNFGYEKYFATGSIVVDTSELLLKNVYIQEIMNEETDKGIEIEEKYYGVGDTINVVCEFNHKMAEQAPDLELKIGDSLTKQDSISYKANNIIYTYKIKANGQNGKVEISKFDYTTNVFKDTYRNQGEFNLQVAESKKTAEYISTKQLIVDTIIPKVTNIKIEYTADNPMVKDGITYIKDLTDVKCVVTYSEPVIGDTTILGVKKGSKYTFWFEGKSDAETERTIEEFDLLSSKRDNSSNEYEGNYEIIGYNNIAEYIVDKAGNAVRTDGNTTYTYTLNGEVIEKEEVCIDKSVYEGIISVENTPINNEIKLNNGSRITCFTEYKNKMEQDYKDLSGIKSIKLKVYDNANTPMVLNNKNGMEVTSTGTEESDREGYARVTYYELDERQLPVSFIPESNSECNVITIKEDQLGNVAENEVKVSVSDLVKLNKDRSILKIIEENGPRYYNYLQLEDCTYYLYLKINDIDDIDALKVQVLDLKNNSLTVKSLGKTTVNGEEYYKYSFELNGPGKYKVNVSFENENEEEISLLNDEITAKNVFTPCDVDCNREIGTMDLTYVLRRLLGLEEDYLIDRSGDVDGNKKLELADAVALANVIAGTGKYQRQGNGYVTQVE